LRFYSELVEELRSVLCESVVSFVTNKAHEEHKVDTTDTMFSLESNCDSKDFPQVIFLATKPPFDYFA
jgi:hypothetical protein